MKSLMATVSGDMGLHARPAVKIMKEAGKYKSTIRLSNKGRSADGKSMVEILRIGIAYGDTVSIECDGEDEETAAAALKTLIEQSK
jgi:phosphocarrier protein HPr